KDLFVLSPGIEGEIEQLLLQNQVEEAKAKVLSYQQLFDANSFFLTIQSFPLHTTQQLKGKVIQLANELNIPIVATNKVCFLEKEDYFAWKCLQAIKN